MLRRSNVWWLVGAVLVLRGISMATLPLTDTTEARYAEIARLMATSSDWITPWFEPGIPFWGKPPLAFWSEALAFRFLGITEFAARLPSWLATIGTLALVFMLGRSFFGRRAARHAVLIYSSSLLPYVAAGAVLTDPFLTLGTTLAMTAFALAPEDPRPIWRYGFFLGLAIGLLAKGPLALVLVMGSLLPWMAWQGSVRERLRVFPWGFGSLLVAMLTLPWYIAAELKTPGFFNYFIIGEHVLRFIDSGWAGDLYGSAHDRPYGSIWLLWIMAAFPWGLIGLGVLVTTMAKRQQRANLRSALSDPQITYLLGWSLFTLVFFTFAGNILWTYVLPALPAFAILLAGYIDRRWPAGLVTAKPRALIKTSVLAVPVMAAALALGAAMQPKWLNTEKELVGYANSRLRPGDQLLFVQKRSFSARFYSRGEAGLVALDQLSGAIAQAPERAYLAVPKDLVGEVGVRVSGPVEPGFESRRYVLLTLPASVGNASLEQPSTRRIAASTPEGVPDHAQEN